MISVTKIILKGIALTISNWYSSVDGFGTIQFCSYTKKEATDLFESWQAENGYNIPEYTVQTVYNRADAEEYGAEYFVKQRNYPE